MNLLTVSVLGLMGWAGYRVYEANAAPTSVVLPKSHTVANWREYAVGGQRVGQLNAPVVVTVFADYQCPFCRQVVDDLQQIRARHVRDVAIIYRQFPLRSHFFAVEAAHSALCAARQQRFEAYNYALFRQQDSIGVVPWARLAHRVGVSDTVSFDNCMSDRSLIAQLAPDIAAGRRLGVTATPTFLVNDVEFVGAPGGQALSGYVERVLRQSRAQGVRQ